MITNLSIKNYALIEDIRVSMNDGLTIITGETGAGKSILLGALSLLLGKRADLSSVKEASKKCIIEGEFALAGYELSSVFDKNDLDYDAHTIIRREILPSGKSRAFVNDSPVSLAQLQKLGLHLVDIHSQNENLSLSSENFQMEVIDALAGNSGILHNYKEHLNEFKRITESLSELKSSKENASKELDYHTFLHSELVEANLSKMNQEELEESFETLNNSEEIQEILGTVSKLFSEEQIGTLETVKEARNALGKLRKFSSVFEDLWTRLNSVIIEMEDIAEEIEVASANVESDPEKLFAVNASLQSLYKLQQKHSVASVSELLKIQDDLNDKINNTLDLDDKIVRVQEERDVLQKKTFAIGEKLHESRVKAIPKLKELLESYLKELGLPNARFKFDLVASESFRKNGTDSLELMFTANKGLDFGPLKKVASGGEMSRIMLSVKAVLAKYKKLPSLIFDEIDTGVSGEIANKMAVIMSEMSRTMQVISITHLPQIAAKGEHHIKIYKEDINEVTVTRLKTLFGDERIVEIAQMIGGEKVTDAAIANAKELLN